MRVTLTLEKQESAVKIHVYTTTSLTPLFVVVVEVAVVVVVVVGGYVPDVYLLSVSGSPGSEGQHDPSLNFTTAVDNVVPWAAPSESCRNLVRAHRARPLDN